VRRRQVPLGADSAAVGLSADDLSCADGTNARFSGERRSEFSNQLGQLVLAGCSFGSERFRTSRDSAESLGPDLDLHALPGPASQLRASAH
jgi:hypothetical protein